MLPNLFDWIPNVLVPLLVYFTYKVIAFFSLSVTDIVFTISASTPVVEPFIVLPIKVLLVASTSKPVIKFWTKTASYCRS